MPDQHRSSRRCRFRAAEFAFLAVAITVTGCSGGAAPATKPTPVTVGGSGTPSAASARHRTPTQGGIAATPLRPATALGWRPVPGSPGVELASAGGAALAWLDTRRLRFRLVAGTGDPPGRGWPWGGEIPAGAQDTLVAAFNSGFKLSDIRGGWYSGGRYARPLLPGVASFVIDRSGRPSIRVWGPGRGVPPDVAAVRQNPFLLIHDGRRTAAVTGEPSRYWGATLHGATHAWRSAVCTDRNQALVFAAGNALSPKGLTDTLLAAGCMDAMQLDINPEWVSFNTYRPRPGHPGLAEGTKRIGSNLRPDNRYLHPDGRDFIAAFRRPAAAG